MNVSLHLLDAEGKLTLYKRRLEDVFTASVAQLKQLLPVPNVDVVVYVDPAYVVPELGTGGFSPAANRIFIAVDPDNAHFVRGLEREFLFCLGHELHHSLRWGAVGYGETLGEVLVTEGLACHFETELRGGAVPPYAAALGPRVLTSLLRKAKTELNNADYNHPTWFFGADSIPLYAGYALGLELVSVYIRERRTKASRLYAEPAPSFLAAFSAAFDQT